MFYIILALRISCQGKAHFIVSEYLHFTNRIFQQEFIQESLNLSFFLYTFAYGHVFGFQDRCKDCMLLYATLSHHYSTKEEVTTSNQLLVFNATSVAIICVFYHPQFSISLVRSIVYWVSFLLDAQAALFFQVI